MHYDTAGILAVQVSNNLMGDDFTKFYSSVSSDVQKKIDSVKDLIPVKTQEAMVSNRAVRELIIRHITTTFLIYHCLSHQLDPDWFDKPEMKNREGLIRKYGSDGIEFPEAENFEKYMAYASGFIKERLQILEEKRGRQ